VHFTRRSQERPFEEPLNKSLVCRVTI